MAAIRSEDEVGPEQALFDEDPRGTCSGLISRSSDQIGSATGRRYHSLLRRAHQQLSAASKGLPNHVSKGVAVGVAP